MSSSKYTQGLHGGEVYKSAASLGIKPENITDFSSNTFIQAKALTENILNAAPLHYLHYPEANNATLRCAIAGFENLPPENVLCGNGAADLIWQFLRYTAPASVTLIGPAFSEYVKACAALGIKYNIISPKAENAFALADDELRKIWENRSELTIICTPNNPAGITYENMGAILRVLNSPRVLFDLSYKELIYDTPLYPQHNWQSYQQAVNPGVSVFCLHSFTKFFCCPGIRLGYLTGDARFVQNMQALQPSWQLSALAQQSGLMFLQNIEDYRALLPELRFNLYHFGVELRRLPVFNPELVFEGPNFFCCGLAGASNNFANKNLSSADALQSFLLKQHILIRNCNNIPGMPAGFVRIQVRTPADNQKLLDILQQA